jgi:hypothetical protein
MRLLLFLIVISTHSFAQKTLLEPKTESLDLLNKNWNFCLEDNLEFQKLQSSQTFKFYRDPSMIDSCQISLLHIRFKMRQEQQIRNSLIGSPDIFAVYFPNEQSVIVDDQNRMLYLFSGGAILAYHIEEISNEMLVLKQDNESTMKLNDDEE